MSPTPQELVERFIDRHPDVPGALLHVRGPGFAGAAAAGALDLGTNVPLPTDATYRIASITKTYVAAAVLRLMETGRVNLDEPLGAYLGDGELAALLGSERLSRIRLRHLLTHTSGLADFVEDTDYPMLMLGDMQRRWTRLEQVELGLTLPDVGSPGELFHYSDTGYVILGEVIEDTTDENLAVSVRGLLGLDRLDLTATYWERLEPVSAGAGVRAHQYIEGIDTFDADPSFDLWGGGGIVSSTGDIAEFFRALFEGEVFDRPETLVTMTDVAAEAEGAFIGMGISGRDIEGARLWGHGGYYGVYSGYLPEHRVALSVAVLERSGLMAVATELLPAAIKMAIERGARN